MSGTIGVHGVAGASFEVARPCRMRHAVHATPGRSMRAGQILADVCPDLQVTHDETHSPTAFHANVVAMDKGLLNIADVAADYVNCTQCGACELRCPNTIFAGDFYRFRTRTVDLVKAMRALAVDNGIHQPGWQRWNE